MKASAGTFSKPFSCLKQLYHIPLSCFLNCGQPASFLSQLIPVTLPNQSRQINFLEIYDEL